MVHDFLLFFQKIYRSYKELTLQILSLPSIPLSHLNRGVAHQLLDGLPIGGDGAYGTIQCTAEVLCYGFTCPFTSILVIPLEELADDLVIMYLNDAVCRAALVCLSSWGCVWFGENYRIESVI